MQRLQKFLAQCGCGSRRHCEDLITAGRVTVNGQVVTELGTKVEVTARVELDSKPVTLEQKIYIVHFKARGTLCTSSDPEGRKIILDALPSGIKERVYTVGRLDMDSDGLILLTNDGDFYQRLAHPSSHVEKEYLVTVAGAVSQSDIDSMSKDTFLDGVPVRGMQIIRSEFNQERNSTRLRLIIEEGKNRQIRKMLETHGYKVRALRRIRIGNLRLDHCMRPGESRSLSAAQIKEIFPQVK